MSTETETPQPAGDDVETAEGSEAAAAEETPAAVEATEDPPAAVPAAAPATEEAVEPQRSPAMDWAVAFTAQQPLGHGRIEGVILSGSEIYTILRGAFGDRLKDHGLIHYGSAHYLVPSKTQWEHLLDETLDLDSRLQGTPWLRGDLAWPLRFDLLRRAAGSEATDPEMGLVPLACGVLVDLPVAGGRSCLNVLISHDDNENNVWIVDPANGRRRPVDGSDRDLTVVYI